MSEQKYLAMLEHLRTVPFASEKHRQEFIKMFKKENSPKNKILAK